MAKKVKRQNGTSVTLLNPSEKGRKYAAELRAGIHATNDHKIKRDKNGSPILLTDTEKAWRSGYLASRKDSANCWKAKQKKK